MSSPPPSVATLLNDMLRHDGFEALILQWPEHDVGRVRIEIRATSAACEDCLVPKEILAMVLREHLPPGIEIDEDDLVYPGDTGAG